MENERLIIALDLGTSSSRAFAVDAAGTVRAQKSAQLSPTRPREGCSEYDAQTLLQSQLDVLHQLLDEVDPQRVAALAVTSQRSTVVLWDKTTGQAVAPVLTWEDGRAYAQAEQANISQEEVHAVTGLYKTPYFSAPKIAWCLQNIPAASQTLEAGRLLAGPVASYLIWHLTQGRTFAADPTLAQRMLLLDIRTQKWSEPLCRAFGVPEHILPSILPSAADYGQFEYKGVSIPICVCAGDQQASVAFAGLEKGQSCINYGTGAFLLYNAGREKPVFLPGLLTSLSVSALDGTCDYLLEGPVNAAGSALMWLKAQGIEFEPADTDALCQAAVHPVWLLPALGGLGAPYWDFSLSPIVAGLSPRTRKPDWVCGMVRAIAFLLADIAAYLRVNGLASQGPVKVSGGLAKSNWLLAYQADLLQTPLLALQDTESTVLGAARLAGERLGWTVSHWAPPVRQTFSPRLEAAAAKTLYGQWQTFVQWCKTYGK